MQLRLSGVAFNSLKVVHDVAIEVYDLFSELSIHFQVWQIHQTLKIVEHVLDIFEKVLLKQLLAIWARCSLRNLSQVSVCWTFDPVDDAHKGFDQSIS